MPRLLAGILALAGPLFADGLIPSLTSAQVKEGRAAIESFKANPKGPFFQIHWYCKDGTVLPPAGRPCVDRGGGNQHAELSPLAKKLNSWNLRVGTILTGLKYEELLDAPLDHHWLRELVLHKYLAEIDNGWIYRRAVSYRGAWQVEDEERAGRQFLVQLFSDRQWILRNYYLAGQLVLTIPHGSADSRVRRIRNLAAALGNQNASFQRIRAKIHGYPGREDVDLVREYSASQKVDENSRTQLKELTKLLVEYYSPEQWMPMLRAAQKDFEGTDVYRSLENVIQEISSGNDVRLLAAAANLTMTIREEVERSADGRKNLRLLDLNAVIHEKANENPKSLPDLPRHGLLTRTLDILRMATGCGLLSKRQLGALRQEVEALRRRESLPAAEYRNAIRYLGRATEWSRATVSRDFGPLVMHYQSVEPLAKSLVDHLLRSSVALPLAQQLDVLLADADLSTGIRHSLFGQASTAGVAGLNPGVAAGKLGMLDQDAIEKGAIDPRGIYVIPQTAADLKPMAGILTLDSGNLLSHAQLLAANLGIPNAVIPSSIRPLLEKASGTEVFYAVTPRNVVVLKETTKLTSEERKLFTEQPAGPRRRITLDTSRLKLDDTRLRKLIELSSRDSGVIVGPKAANLGQLASYFPNEVAPGVVVPFGIFQTHIARDLDDSGKTLEQQIIEANAQAERLRDQGAEPSTISSYMYPRLAHFRKVIQSMPLMPAFEKQLIETMRREFGEEGSYGVFVRSDTNAEDLPEFTGAGLNLTVPNVVGEAKILKAVRDVWASPFTERAYDWRSRAMRGTEKVYPSVIVMEAVPSDKSGVIATVDLENGDTSSITVNASEGVSAVVDGGVAESLLLTREAGVRLLQQCRATYRKTLKPGGGFQNLPALGGDTLLTPEEISQVRKLVREVNAKYPPAKSESGATLPWDIEFGFERGALRLFQIRPLVRFQEWTTLEALSRLEGEVPRDARVALHQRPLP
jgi:hypothetical protein